MCAIGQLTRYTSGVISEQTRGGKGIMGAKEFADLTCL